LIVFPIHIIELLTLALVLLAIYRVFKAESFESSQVDSKCAQQIPESGTQRKSAQQPTMEETAPENQGLSEPVSISMQHTEPSRPKSTRTLDTKQTCNQAALKNYIGDFF